MTLNQLGKLNPRAAASWRAGFHKPARPHRRSRAELEHRTFRAYRVNGALFAVWNNGCFYENFKWDPGEGEWRTLAVKGSRSYRSKYYARAVKTLGDLDVGTMYG
jgi:hypothetical protein